MNWIPFETCRLILLSVPIACVDIAIVSEGRILLVERMDAPAEGQYWLPGGRVHKGELLKDAASRKALVEVGIACNVRPIVHTAEKIFDDGLERSPIDLNRLGFRPRR
jgi:colanic acid biosynthesis protein WcaH